MDTVEWGTVEPDVEHEPEVVPRRRVVIRIPAVLVVIGFALLVASTLLPWASAESAGSSNTLGDGPSGRTVNFGLPDLSVSALTYELGLVVLLGLVGMVLTVNERRRTALWGAAIGVAAAQVLILIGTIQWLTHLYTSGQLGTVNTDGAPKITLDRGVYLAGAGLLLIVAALVAQAMLPAREPRISLPAQLPPAPPDEPDDLTVTPAPSPAVLPANQQWTQGNLTTRD